MSAALKVILVIIAETCYCDYCLQCPTNGLRCHDNHINMTAVQRTQPSVPTWVVTQFKGTTAEMVLLLESAAHKSSSRFMC